MRRTQAIVLAIIATLSAASWLTAGEPQTRMEPVGHEVERATAGYTAHQAPARRGARAESEHFVVTAPSREMATRVAQYADVYRRELAQEWLGRELPPWRSKWPIQVVFSQNSSGVTSAQMGGSGLGGKQMVVRGSPQEILTSVLPHEVNHTVFMSHFRHPVPRWADEGACTTIEDERARHRRDQALMEYLRTGGCFPTNRLMSMRQYPQGKRQMLAMYSQGYSLARFLIAQSGRRDFIRYLETYFDRGSWTEATREHYGYQSLQELQDNWLAWVRDGSGDVSHYAGRSNDELVAIAKQQCGPGGCPPGAGMGGGMGGRGGMPVPSLADGRGPRVPDPDPPYPNPAPKPDRTDPEPELEPEPAPELEPQTTASPSSQCECDMEAVVAAIQQIKLDCPEVDTDVLADKVADRIKSDPGTPAPQGPTEPRGPDGRPGTDARVGLDELADAVADRLKEQCRPLCDEDLERVAQMAAEIVGPHPPRGVVLVDGAKGEVLDRETYQPGEPIVLDIQQIIRSSGTN